MTISLEKTILKTLIQNEEFCRKTIPYIKPEYLKGEDKALFGIISNFLDKYNQRPTIEALQIEIDSLNISSDELSLCQTTLKDWEVPSDQPINMDWLMDSTEQFCQDKAIYLAMTQAIEIMNNKKDGTLTKGAIPSLLSDALSVSFDPRIGHDYFADFESRYDYYHKVEFKVPFDLDYFNKITKGGVSRKTLNILLAGPNVGKSLFMCHFAAANVMMGKKVLYITLEMAEEEISKRIDANLLNITMDDLIVMPRDLYVRKMSNLRSKTMGDFIVHEYPTASASVQHFRMLLNDLKIKKNFIPDIIYVDYLNICASSRVKQGGSVNSYTYIKSIAEEIRGLAIEFNLPIFTATQTTRGGFNSSDPGLEDTSESFGVPAIADFLVALVTTDDLVALNQIMVKQLKNRYADKEVNKRFVVGIDRPKMKLYDTEISAQSNIMDSNQTPTQVESPTQKWGRDVDVNKDKFKRLKV